MERIESYFGCGCFDLEHVIHLSYFPPEKSEKKCQLSPLLEETDEDTVIYLSKFRNQFRKRIFLFSLRDLFDPYCWKYELFFKREWANRYYTSFWKRLSIGFRYLFNSKNQETSILDSITLQKKDLKRFVDMLTSVSKYYQKEIIEKYKSHRIEGMKDDLELQFDDEDEKFKELSICHRFKEKKGFRKIIYFLRYIFNILGTNQDNFYIYPRDAAIWIEIIREYKNEIRDY